MTLGLLRNCVSLDAHKAFFQFPWNEVQVFTPQQGKFSLQLMEMTTGNDRHTKCRTVEPVTNVYKTVLHPGLGDYCRGGRTLRSGEWRTYWESVSPTNIRSYIHKGLAACLPKWEPNKDDTSGHAMVDREKPTRPQLYTKNYSQLRKTGSRRGACLYGRAHQLALQCQTVSPEIVYTS